MKPKPKMVWVGYYVSERRLKSVNKDIDQWRQFKKTCQQLGYKPAVYRCKELVACLDASPIVDYNNAVAAVFVPESVSSLLGLHRPVHQFSELFAKNKFVKSNRIC